MADGFDVKTTPDGRVIVVLHATCKISKEEILTLLREAGIDVEDVVFLTPEEALSMEDLDDVPIVIPLDAEVCDLPELDKVAQSCGSVGGRVVVVFCPDFSYDGLHPIADKYGTQCGWSSRDLENCIAGPEVGTPRDATGAQVRRGETKPVTCRT